MRTIVITGLFAAIAFAGCKSMDSSPQSDAESLNYNGQLTIRANSSHELKVTLLSLKDTRCPHNVICIQPGWVDLSLMVRDQLDSVRVETSFHASAEKDKVRLFKLGDYNYALQVYSVLPLPTEGKKLDISEYTVGLSIAPQ